MQSGLQALGLPCCPPLPRHGQGWGAGCPQHGVGDQPLLGKGPGPVSLPQQSQKKSGGASLLCSGACWAASSHEEERRGEQVIMLTGEQITFLFPAGALALKNAVSE